MDRRTVTVENASIPQHDFIVTLFTVVLVEIPHTCLEYIGVDDLFAQAFSHFRFIATVDFG